MVLVKGGVRLVLERVVSYRLRTPLCLNDRAYEERQ